MRPKAKYFYLRNGWYGGSAWVLYKKTKNLRAVQILLGHTKLESTVRYLGVEVDDALELSETTDI